MQTPVSAIVAGLDGGVNVDRSPALRSTRADPLVRLAAPILARSPIGRGRGKGQVHVPLAMRYSEISGFAPSGNSTSKAANTCPTSK
jgi:hypothetical protein